MTNTPVRFAYVAADGAIWKFNRSDLARLANGEYFADVKYPMSTPSFDDISGCWKNLPAALYSNPGDPRVGSWKSGHQVLPGTDHADEHAGEAARLLAEGA